jgi:uncharacterized protein (TIGR00251 family)
MIALEERSDGVLLPVKAQPGARQNAIRGEQNGMLKVSVTQAPEKGKANQAIIAVLATALDLKRSQIELVSGDTSSQKKFLIRSCPREVLVERIKAILPQTEPGTTKR